MHIDEVWEIRYDFTKVIFEIDQTNPFNAAHIFAFIYRRTR